MIINYAPKLKTGNGRTAEVNTVDMYYEEYGSGRPLLLLHGFGGSGQNWYPFLDALAERHRLIVVDLPGHGHSSDPTSEFTHRQAALDVLLLLEKLGIHQLSAMGISSGGMTLLHMATIASMRIEAMVLVSATTHFPVQARDIMREASFARMPQHVQDMYRACAKRGDAQIRQLIAQFNALADNFDDMNFTEEDLSVINARTLIVHGDRDSFFPIEIPVSLYRSIPDSQLWIIPNGEHVPVYDPMIPFAATAMRFLDPPACA
ncbi:alpha/beta hydrolase [Phyllobacterium phragmitis]|uniref:Alpha/beta hydrolase n=1 Tax=Phyllobacterium phragmitis TaxID=2670329 RepID=A0A2S9IRA5_9HYPH|nr:alpha/beta fold hydrolase [Phyllobacterium phragmitis]PRD43061.1 alpha/beta hydrolase [Phyllobacterium phragmitis]